MTNRRALPPADRQGDQQLAEPGPAVPVSPAPEQHLLRVELPGGGHWELAFTWQGDRWGHRLTLVAGDGRRLPLLTSDEGTPQQAWPPSPPLQAFHVQTLADGRQVALLVGMAGRSHWSASVEPMPAAAGFRFDLACRHPDAPGWIGSTCQFAEAARTHLEVWPLPGTQVDITRSPRASRADQLRAWPAAAPLNSGTVRWGYELHARHSLPAPDLPADR